jgi:hypothetical protein
VAVADIELPGVRTLRLQEGDVLLLQAPGRLTDEESAIMIEQIEAMFPGHRALVLESGVALTVARIEVH